MLKLMSFLAATGAAIAVLPLAAQAAPVGPFAPVCATGKPAVLARVMGVKAPRGTLMVKLYPSGSKFLDKGAYVRKVRVPVTRTGPIDVCVPVPESGVYAISVRHKIGGTKSRADGGGFSGNPKVSLVDLALNRKPPANKVSFQVGRSTRVVPVVLNYLQGSSFRPVA